jgi:signal transduction histidine kinase
VQVVGERLRPLAALKQVALDVCTTDTARVAIPADDAELLCSNLMMNALQHSLPGGHVSATVQLRGSVSKLHIVDQGEGIPEAALPHIFERFYRADRSRSRNSGGAGLGLSICKAIVERANGTIHIQSVVGKGTEVWVTVPATSLQDDASLGG